MTQWLSQALHDLRRLTNLPVFLACLVVLTGWLVFEKQALKNHLDEQRARIAAEVAVLRVNLEGAINGPIQLVRGLIAVIVTEPDMDQDRFAALASTLIEKEPLLRNLAAAPDLVIQMIYPVEGNIQAIGLDYTKISEQREAALRARDIGDLVLAGPVDLVQGGQGFIGRFPVYLRSDDGAPEFWGLVSAVIDLEALYSAVGLNQPLPFAVTLTGRDAMGDRGLRFFGPEITARDQPVVSTVYLPSGTWQIAAMPFGGWDTHHPQIWAMRLVLAAAAVLILLPSIGMGRSMEARKRAIEELKEVNTTLQHQMLDLEAARAAQAQAEVQLRQAQKLEAVGQLTGGVAHDFNNLLTVILGNSELLVEKLQDREDLRKFAQMTVNAAERGAELTNRLLAFSRKQPLQPRVLNVGAQLCNNLESLLRRTLPESVTLQIEREDNDWLAEIDPGQLEAALLNIVLNARDAMPEGGRITLTIKDTEIDEDAAQSDPEIKPGQYVMITVTDTGHGMSEETLMRVFEPFFTTKEVGRGSGLGLSMVYGFVRQSGGHVRITSRPDNGTTIVLYFPRSLSEATENDAPKPRQPISGGKETILLVEDDDLVRQQVRASLLGLGYYVVEAENGPQAIEILQKLSHVDLLFTDIVLPGGMNGRSLANAAQALRPNLKVLFTSGYTENAMIHHDRLDPEVELLSKPYRRSELAEKLRKVLG